MKFLRNEYESNFKSQDFKETIYAYKTFPINTFTFIAQLNNRLLRDAINK